MITDGMTEEEMQLEDDTAILNYLYSQTRHGRITEAQEGELLLIIQTSEPFRPIPFVFYSEPQPAPFCKGWAYTYQRPL